MGNPLAPALANVFLCHLESIIFTSCPSDIRPKFYHRYLDDTFAVFDTEEHADRFCEFLNCIHNNISFTTKKKNNSKLSFLDLNIENTSGSFSSSVFRKATFTGLEMNFLNYCPLINKINTIKTLLHRAYKLSSNYLNFTQEVEYLRNLFYNNSYPSDFFERQVYKFLYKIRQSPAELITVERKQIFLSFPYFGPSSFELSKKLTKILSKSGHRLRVIYTFVK